MKMKTFFSIIYVIYSYHYCVHGLPEKALKPLIPGEVYTNKLIVNEDKPEQYQLFWKKLNEDELQFEVHCNTTGWIAVGFSDMNGDMIGSDIAIGWVKNNQAFIKDCYADAQKVPKRDPQQDFILLDGAEINGYTILKFKRKLVTCEKIYDKEIKAGTHFLIFAWNNDDPATGDNDWTYHGSNRFSKTTVLLNYKNETLEEQNNLPSDTFTHTITANNVELPAKSIYYFCNLHALPSFDNPVHLIQFEILVNQKKKQNFHHVLVFECSENFAPKNPIVQDCGSIPLPYDVQHECAYNLIIAWGSGGQYNHSFPKRAGYRIEKTTKTRYLLLEIRYDNPHLENNIVDNSGIKLYFTKQLRQNDLGLLRLGYDENVLSLEIPPQSNYSSFTSICYPECTKKYFPEDGIYAVSGLFLTNSAGRSVKTTLVRKGVAIQDLFENPTYDFKHQYLIDIEPVKLYRGDVLITKCKFQTSDRNKFTFMSSKRLNFGTHDEICNNFLYYYPKLPNLNICVSGVSSKVLGNFYMSLLNNLSTPLLPFPSLFAGSSFFKYYYRTRIIEDLNQTFLNQRYEEFYNSNYDEEIYCGDSDDDSLYIDRVSHYVPISNQIIANNSCKDTTTELLNNTTITFTNITVTTNIAVQRKNIEVITWFLLLNLVLVS